MGVNHIEIVGKVVGVVLVLIVSAACVLATLAVTQSVQYQIASVHNVVNMGTLSASDGLILSTESLDWGEVYPDSNVTKPLSVTNIMNAPCQLYLTTSGWVPANASDFMTLTWNYNGAAVDVDETVDLVLTLTISAEVEGITDFSFNTTITGVT